MSTFLAGDVWILTCVEFLQLLWHAVCVWLMLFMLYLPQWTDYFMCVCRPVMSDPGQVLSARQPLTYRPGMKRGSIRTLHETKSVMLMW